MTLEIITFVLNTWMCLISSPGTHISLFLKLILVWALSLRYITSAGCILSIDSGMIICVPFMNSHYLDNTRKCYQYWTTKLATQTWITSVRIFIIGRLHVKHSFCYYFVSGYSLKGKGSCVGFKLNNYWWFAEQTSWLFNQSDYL